MHGVAAVLQVNMVQYSKQDQSDPFDLMMLAKEAFMR